MSLTVVCDARPAQPGFKAHAQRGIGRYCRELVRALERLPQAPGLELLLQAGLPDPGLAPGAPRHRAAYGPGGAPAGRRLLGQHWLARRALARCWGQGKVVHFLSHLDAPCRVGPRTVITVHDLIIQKLARRFRGRKGRLRFKTERWLETRSLYQAAHILANSEHTKRDLVELVGLAPDGITVTHLAAAPGLAPCPDRQRQQAVLQGLGLAPDRPFFLYLGGVDPRKDLGTLLAALARLGEQGLAHDLVLAGRLEPNPATRALERDIRRLGLGKSVHLVGFIPESDLPALFSACLAFVYPTFYEGFGLPPLEAMACGAPVVASRVASLPEVVGRAGILVEPGRVEDMARALANLAQDRELAAELGRRGRERAAQFSWQKTAQRTLEVYREVAGEP